MSAAAWVQAALGELFRPHCPGQADGLQHLRTRSNDNDVRLLIQGRTSNSFQLLAMRRGKDVCLHIPGKANNNLQRWR